MTKGESAAEPRRRRLLAAARRTLAGDDGPDFLAALAGDLFGHVTIEDLAAYTAPEIAGFVRSAARALTGRTPGRPLVRVSNPDFECRGRGHREVTLVETVNDNMPYLFDSLLAEIQDFGAEVSLVAHPIVAVVRDTSGRLATYRGRAIGKVDPDTTRESLIQIHVARLPSAEACAQLAERLDGVLSEVQRAVQAWPAMQKRLSEATTAFKTTSSPMPADEIEETIAFLEWLLDGNFTMLGMREYDFVGSRRTGELKRRDTPGLGILSDPAVRIMRRGGEAVTTTPTIREFLMRPEALIITKANLKSRVHRRAYIDYVGIKLFSATGRLEGELRLVGLFTATAYTQAAAAIPLLRGKIARVLERAGHDPESHSGRALYNVLESYPRDELFQIDVDLLYQFCREILMLEERPRVRALVRVDKFDRFVSVIVFVPRDRYDSMVRERIGAHLAHIFDGRVSAFYPAFPEAMPLTRIHFIIGRSGGRTPTPERGDLEAGIARIVRTWRDGLHYRLALSDAAHAVALGARYQDAFPPAYRDDFPPEVAVADIAAFERLNEASPLAVRFHPGDPDRAHVEGLTLIHLATSIALSERVPMLENMGFRVIDERSYEVEPRDRPPVHVHDMALQSAVTGVADIGERAVALTACLTAVWYGRADNDRFNALVLAAGLDWRQAALMRAVARYLRQAGISYTMETMAAALVRHPAIAGTLVSLFDARFDPDRHDAAAAVAAAAAIEQALERVDSLDEDRIVRRFANVISAMVRTNVFQRTEAGAPGAEISFKLDSGKVDGLPEPKPFREIFVHSPQVDGVHLRFGNVARGGIRWSDRPHDFRTEILGLAKAQQVKNAVIVPVGAKGGFVPRKLPAGGDRDQVLAEATSAYRRFIASLLDITDNLDGETVVQPPRVVRHDGDDPYLVVAADKGTATFSDLANAIADGHHFWLSDAFASGGSAGYDHKAMGITARGAWEAVKRHFRELDVDIQATPFSVVGVGDMSGDVFGNGMLLSQETRLVAAFDHRDVFIDPDPDRAVSFAERKRLFGLTRSSWQDYDRDKISAGGGVFSRREKSIRLSREMRALTGLAVDRAPPAEIVRALLKAKVDLLWFGGIGTFVRGAAETDAHVADRANDAIRITAEEIGARVVGEGANLALTQRARIEYGLAGGRCNSDAVDNSAGVNTSDVEVNIKIALRPAVASGRIDRRRRNRLLKAMTGEVARLVLRNNYLQTLAISLTERRGFEDFGWQRRLMQNLEGRGRLNRTVEELPTDAAMAERQKAGRPLTRPEIGVLVAYAKIVLFDDLVASDAVDDAALARSLAGYFPERMRSDFAEEIAQHRLRREIVATVIANQMINRGSATYVIRMADRTGATPDATARAYVAVREVFGLGALNDAIDKLDGKVAGEMQLALYRRVQDLLLSETAWFLRNASFAEGVDTVVARYAATVGTIRGTLSAVLPGRLAERVAKQADTYRAAGVPDDLAADLAGLPVLAHATDIHLAAESVGGELERVAAVYLAASEDLRIARITALAHSMTLTDYYDELALGRALDSLDMAHRRITVAALSANGGEPAPLEAWLGRHNAAASHIINEVTAMSEGGELTVSRVSVAADLLNGLVDGAR